MPKAAGIASLYFLKRGDVPATARIPAPLPARQSLLSFALATAATIMTVTIPGLTGRAIDQIREGDDSALKLLGAAVLLAGTLRLGLTVFRRLVAGRVSLGVERDLRGLMYEHLQKLELGFFDSQQTGQLMSRTTVDLQAVRFFLGYGLVFMIQSALTIVLAAIAMLLTDPGLAAISLAPVPFVVLVAARYGRRSRPAVQEVQQRIAELTAEVEENVSGVRVVKAFAAEDRAAPSASSARSAASSSSRWSRRASRPSTARSSASCRSSGSRRSSSSAGAR